MKNVYEETPFGIFSYDRKRFYDNDLLGKEFIKLIGQNNNVIDVGCGKGFILEYLESYGIKKENILGVELSRKSVEICKGKGFNCILGDNTNLTEIKSNSYDITISNGVIHHTADYLKSLDELIRITKKAGYIYLSVYNLFHPYFIIYTLSAPIRLIYHKLKYGDKIVFTIFYPIYKYLYFLPVMLFATNKLLNENDCKTLFMDQILTPIAKFKTIRNLREIIISRGCRVLKKKREKFGQMLTFIIEKA